MLLECNADSAARISLGTYLDDTFVLHADDGHEAELVLG
jgi:hypothetical protein